VIEAVRLFREEAGGSGGYALKLAAESDEIQVSLENPGFRPALLQRPRSHDLIELLPPGTARAARLQSRIEFGDELHCDRARAAQVCG
jgi:hypothetical protein